MGLENGRQYLEILILSMSYAYVQMWILSYAWASPQSSVKHMYKIAPSSSPYQSRTNSFNDKLKDDFKVEKIGVRIFTQPEVDAELHNMRSMPAHEVAAAAAQAVVEAEAAIAEAEMAAREAEAAEAEAEAAQIFVEAAMKACQKLSV